VCCPAEGALFDTSDPKPDRDYSFELIDAVVGVFSACVATYLIALEVADSRPIARVKSPVYLYGSVMHV
jgi:hypothetical protein